MHLVSNKLTLIGTVRKNKLELPVSFTNPNNRTVYSTVFVFQEKATIVSFCPEKGKVVTSLSFMHSTYDVDTNLQKSHKFF